MQNKKVFFSLNVKIFLFLFLSVACIFSLFLTIFMLSYVRQLDQEAAISRKKTEALYELFDENIRLRNIISELRKQMNAQQIDSLSKLWNEQNDDFILKHRDDRFLAIRRELFQDMKGADERNKKVKVLGYFILFSLLFLFFILVLLWLIVRRWILKPIENLLLATHHIACGDLSFRVPISKNVSQQDELDLLARAFNQMAENIEKSIQHIETNKEFLKNLINAIPDGIRVIDENYNIVLTNSAYQKMAASHQKCFEFCGFREPCGKHQNPCPLLLLKENPKQPVNVIQHYIDQQGRESYMEVSAAASFLQTGERTTLQIIESVRPLDKAILFSHQQKLSAIGMLASSVAHEMRNPLGSIRLILENVLDNMKTISQTELERYLNLINEQIVFCINVTARLLKLSKKSDKKFTLIDLNEVISETSCLLEYEAKKAGVDLQINNSPQPAVIYAIDAEMRMMTVNLMQNAFHAMPKGGVMSIRIFTSSDFVHVDFSDTGRGIEPEDLSRIFEPFFSKSFSRDSTEGTGLGLSIVKTIVENCGGSIVVESVLGKGSVFHLKFKSAGK